MSTGLDARNDAGVAPAIQGDNDKKTNDYSQFPRSHKEAKERGETTCRKCPATLVVGHNWALSRAKKGDRRCKSCDTAQARVWRQANLDRCRAVRLAHRQANPERERETAR